MKLFLLCPVSTEPGHRTNDLWGHGYPCQVQAWSQSLLRHSHAQIDDGVAKEVVLPEERCLHAAPHVHW
jgi:hypothetical protein